jgi:hypothetical protein
MPDPKENTAPPSRQAAERGPKWKLSAIGDLGSNLPQAMLICDGLLGMCFTGTKCEIGFLAVRADGDPLLEKHQPEITVVAVYSGNRAEVLFQRKWPRETPTFQTAKLSVTNPSGGIYVPRFFLKDVPDMQDFSKVVDLEHDLNGGRKLNIVRGAFKPRIQVKQGDFHSLLLSPQEYEAVPWEHSGPVIPLGHIAYMTAANLHCDPTDGAVVLNIDDGMDIHSWLVKNRRIFVIIHNNCQEDGIKCYEPSPDETTDFHLYYLAMSSPNKYKIVCKDPSDPSKPGKPTLPNFKLLHEDVERALFAAGLIGPEPRTTNPTPCGIGGFGEGNSLEGS